MDKFIEYKQINPDHFDKVLAAFEDLDHAKNIVVAREKACDLTASLFPSFTDTDTNDGLLTDLSLELYGYHRSLGLTVSDTAYSIEMSSKKLYEFLNGTNISLEKFVDLIKSELFARAELKVRLLKDIEQSSNAKNHRTSLTLLEKLYPEEFGSRGGLEDKLDKLVEKEWKINIVDTKALDEGVEDE